MKVLFSGSFDPFTKGHLAVVKKLSTLFDEVVVAVLNNEQKHYLFSLSCRTELVKRSVADLPIVSVFGFDGLLVDACKAVGCSLVVKGLRNATDLEYEAAMAKFNEELAGVQTLYVVADGAFRHVSSSAVKELWKQGADYSAYVPDAVFAAMEQQKQIGT